MLVFIGLGLFSEKDITQKGLEEARSCDVLFAEFYTSLLGGTSPDKLQELIGREIKVLSREEVEETNILITEGVSKKVGFLVAGDPLISTTHISLRLNAKKKGVETRVVHNASIHSAAPAISGLFNYKFGRSASIPFPEGSYMPESFYDALKENMDRGLHTMLFLDIQESPMTAKEAARYLLKIEDKKRLGIFTEDTMAVALGQVGSDNPVIAAGAVRDVLNRDLGPPPHLLIIPGKLHFMEEEYLREFGGL